MKIFTRLFMALHVFLYRASGGRFGGNMNGFKVLILNTLGRKSGVVHSNPVGYFERDGAYLVVASNGGATRHPAWYHNIKANPTFDIQVMDKVFAVQAEISSGEKRAALWKSVVAEAPAFGRYEKSTAREIPLILLRPAK
jgi:deazaflavin-dependent oxidoreductase (nitroreductase family)